MDSFINIERNDKFSSFTEKDLKDVLNIIDNFYLEYRYNLGLEEHVTFAPGDNIAARYHVLSHAQSARAEITFVLSRLNEDRRNNIAAYRLLLPHGKNKAINFGNIAFHDILNKKIQNTVENRIYNGTIEEIIIQNNINTSTKMILAPTKGLIDEEYLDYKIEKLMKNDWLSEIDQSYYRIKMQDALEFVDFTFDNNLDKAYFLKQYLKDYQKVTIALPSQRVEKAKRFIK